MVAELIGVTKTYGAVVAVRDVSLALEAGRVTAILGPNGAGKTTVVRLLMGLTRPSRGAARRCCSRASPPSTRARSARSRGKESSRGTAPRAAASCATWCTVSTMG